MSLSTNVETIEDRKDYTYHARTVKIKVSSSKTVLTPIRAVTNSEMKAKSTIPVEIPIDADIGVIVKKLTTGRLNNIESFLKENLGYKRILDSIQSCKLKMKYYPMVFSLIQPVGRAIEFLHEANLVNKFIRMSIRSQIDLGFDVITIPWLKLPVSKLTNIYETYLDQYPEKEFILFVDAENENLTREILKYIKSHEGTGQVNFLGVLYRRYSLPTYDAIWETLKDVDIAIVIGDVERVVDIGSVYDLSGIHYEEFIVGDVLFSKVGIGGRGEPKKPIEKQIRFFRRDYVDVPTLGKVSSENMWADKIASEVGDNRLLKPLQNYKEAERDLSKRNVLYSISRVHEFKISGLEVKTSQKYIRQNSTIDYIKSKPTLRKIFIKTLSGFS